MDAVNVVGTFNTRGGPLTCRTALALQGVPLNELLLTRESQRELQEMASNAMSTTLVRPKTIRDSGM